MSAAEESACDEKRRVPPNFHSTARGLCYPSYYKVFQSYIATIRKQYWLGMGFSNAYVYADEFSKQYAFWTLYGSIVHAEAIFTVREILP